MKISIHHSARKSPRTSIGGAVFALGAALYIFCFAAQVFPALNLFGHGGAGYLHIRFTESLAIVIMGIGGTYALLSARDNIVTSEDAGVKPPPATTDAK